MATSTINAYFIECITNMHTGSGDTSYGVVDKLVQRDPVTSFPTIHSSSLKGALREHFEKLWVDHPNKVEEIFGKEVKNGKDSKSGSFKFFGADLIALPVRSNYKQYSLALSTDLIESINKKCMFLTKKLILSTPELEDTLYSKTKPSYDVYFEDELFRSEDYQILLNSSAFQGFDDHYAICSKEKFADFARNLPVIARNQLNNGISKNLWYEEVVPHQTLFITYILVDEKYQTEFEDELLKEGKTVQIGGNASIGYGVCKFYKI
ncbi:MAG: type III-B CRISPR module RAMP protein Cmr4 [Bacteroidetes bacterium]|nr:type III-B CRISPR module RAMP protein Cmr4 [Bacteroidota bacterium]